MNRVDTAQSRCWIGVARREITPPVGIYHRMWGAALHDQATGVHRPLTATLLWMEASDSGDAQLLNKPQTNQPRLIIGLDHCILDRVELDAIRRAICAKLSIEPQAVLVTLSHTHGSGWMSRTRSAFPGGDLIAPYLDQLVAILVDGSLEASAHKVSASIVYGTGRCDLAGFRDKFDSARGHRVCGFEPEGSADDTLLVAKLVSDDHRVLGTLVNYACHPTALAWDNTLISPDWVGAMRQTIEAQTSAPCLFLQGASGDLGPRDGFVGDTAVADRNGRQVGFAALSTLTSLPEPSTCFEYAGPVLSGTWIGTWKHRSLEPTEISQKHRWLWRDLTIEVAYRHDLPTIESTTQLQQQWMAAEQAARESGDQEEVRRCRANGEQMTRQLARLNALVPGTTCPVACSIAILGDAIWVFVPGEFYQLFQLELRKRFAPRPVIVVTLTGDWQPGYFPTAVTYGYGIYQEVIAVVAAGSLETVQETLARAIQEML